MSLGQSEGGVIRNIIAKILRKSGSVRLTGVLTVRRVGVERLGRVLTKPGVVRVESLRSRHVPALRQTVGVGGVLVGVP